jgi:hypothetical protein
MKLKLQLLSLAFILSCTAAKAQSDSLKLSHITLLGAYVKGKLAYYQPKVMIYFFDNSLRIYKDNKEDKVRPLSPEEAEELKSLINLVKFAPCRVKDAYMLKPKLNDYHKDNIVQFIINDTETVWYRSPCCAKLANKLLQLHDNEALKPGKQTQFDKDLLQKPIKF